MTSYISMDLLHGNRTKGHGLVLHEDKHVMILRFPYSWVLKIMVKAVLLTFVVISLPWIGSMISETFNSRFERGNASDVHPLKVETLPQLFHDFRNEGLLRMGDRALFVSNGDEDEEAIYNSESLRDYGMDVISYSDSMRQRMIPDETFDFAFMHGIHADIKVIDRVLKVSGIVVVQLNIVNSKVSFQKPSNYNIVYLRQFDSTIMAMRKTKMSHINNHEIPTWATNRKLLHLTTDAKKAALKKLENVLLEPPRAYSGKSNTYLKKTRYLPDLMGDSLESYPRRVFINVAGGDGARWFEKNYPTRNTNFEIYEVETVAETSMEKLSSPKGAASVAQVPREMSDWLSKTVKEEDYLVMKAEAEVVEEMVRSKTIKLVDELFMECKHQGVEGKISSSRRAYWECLALYGTLRDEGVAVHQWWG